MFDALLTGDETRVSHQDTTMDYGSVGDTQRILHRFVVGAVLLVELSWVALLSFLAWKWGLVS